MRIKLACYLVTVNSLLFLRLRQRGGGSNSVAVRLYLQSAVNKMQGQKKSLNMQVVKCHTQHRLISVMTKLPVCFSRYEVFISYYPFLLHAVLNDWSQGLQHFSSQISYLSYEISLWYMYNNEISYLSYEISLLYMYHSLMKICPSNLHFSPLMM